jgi:hypothetical protein
MYKVTTTDGVLVNSGQKGVGLSEAEATADATDRNRRAEALGVKTRYEACSARPADAA